MVKLKVTLATEGECVKFRELDVGDYFKYCDRRFLKLSHIAKPDNAFDFSRKELSLFGAVTPVIPLYALEPSVTVQKVKVCDLTEGDLFERDGDVYMYLGRFSAIRVRAFSLQKSRMRYFEPDDVVCPCTKDVRIELVEENEDA